MSNVKVDKWLNPDGTENYKCRAMLKWDGTTNIIRNSGNVSSITDNGVGDFTVNFTIPFVDQHYITVHAIQDLAGYTLLNYSTTLAGSLRFFTGKRADGANVDVGSLGLAFFR